MAGRKGGLGRGISSLIPTHSEQRRGARPERSGEAHKRPVDVFFDGVPDRSGAHADVEAAEAAERALVDSHRPKNGTGSKKADSKAARKTQSVEESGPVAQSDSSATDAAAASVVVSQSAATAHRKTAESGRSFSGQAADLEHQPGADGADAAQPADLAAVPGLTLVEVNPNDVVPNPVQPRKEFDEEALEELIHSVREFGVLQPIVVRSRDAGGYELIMGERRLRASKAAGLTGIPAIVRETADDDMLRDALLENLHRANLNPLEEASAYEQLMKDFGITQEQLAQRIGRSRPQVSNTLRLLKLPTGVQAKVAAGVLSAGHARALLAIADTHDIEKVADKVVQEGLSVRETEQMSEHSPRRKAKAKARAGGVQDQLHEVAERLEDLLDTRVRVTLSKKKGQVVIDFATVGDLNRIVGTLGVKGFGEH